MYPAESFLRDTKTGQLLKITRTFFAHPTSENGEVDRTVKVRLWAVVGPSGPQTILESQVGAGRRYHQFEEERLT